MSLSAPPRCSLFVPVPGSEQLAPVKELNFWSAISLEKVNPLPLSTSIHLYSPSFFPCTIAPLSHQVFPRICSWTCLVGLRLRLDILSEINKRVGFCLAWCSTCQQTTLRCIGGAADMWNKQGAINCGTQAEIHHKLSYKFNFVNCQSVPPPGNNRWYTTHLAQSNK